MKYELNIPRSEINRIIDEWVFNHRDRQILKRRYLDGIQYERLAEEFDLSTQRVKAICYKYIAVVHDHKS